MLIDHLPNHTLDEIAALVNIDEHTLLRTVMVQSDEDMIMIIMPDDYFFDIASLAHQLELNLKSLGIKKEQHLLTLLNLNVIPPLPDVVGCQAIVEKDILSLTEIYFKPDLNNALIGMKKENLMTLLKSAQFLKFGFPLTQLIKASTASGGVSESIKQLTPLRIKQRLKETIELPAIPAIAHKILKLRFNYQSTSKQLAEVLEKDPSLSAQLMSWAKSPYYGYSGKIQSLDEAIVKVLGYDLVMNLALGIILSRTMTVSVNGPLGLRTYWEFAILCAALVEAMLKLIPHAKRPMIGLAYLGGLLHNFGHLLLAQIFPPHFELLTQYVVVNPKAAMLDVEHYVLGIGHDEIGAWLLESWKLPPEVIAAIRYHHDENYQGEYAIYPNLVLIATRLLKSQGIGDANSCDLPLELMQSLSLKEADLLKVLENVLSQREDLFELVQQVVPK